MKHFSYYPKIEYSENEAINIMVRGKIRDLILQNSALYYKYTVADGERPDIISSKYYGNSSYTWAIFYANNIFDPQTEWVLDYTNFIKYMSKKYSSIQYTNETIHHYEYYDFFSKKTFIIDQNTYNDYLGTYEIDEDDGRFRQVSQITIYDYENSLNESRRNIVVLDKTFLSQITNELSNLFD